MGQMGKCVWGRRSDGRWWRGGEACPRFAAHLRLALLELGMLGILARGHRQKGGEHRDGQQSCAHHRCVVVVCPRWLIKAAPKNFETVLSSAGG